MVNDVVYAAEVIGSLHDIINPYRFVSDAMVFVSKMYLVCSWVRRLPSIWFEL